MDHNHSLADLLAEKDVGRVVRGQSLADVTRWQIGGPADVGIEPNTAEDIAEVLKIAEDHGAPVLVIGDGSNLLLDSRGFFGIVLRVGRGMSSFRVEGTRVICGAGIWVPELALRLSRLGLTGVEHIVGIPGTLGGLVVMNGGSQRKGIGNHVRRVSIVRRDGTRAELSYDDLAFSYRYSALQGTAAIVTEVELDLAIGSPNQVRSEMRGILSSRRRKFPKSLPNCGSTFLSNPAMYEHIGPPGRVIEQAGFKGAAIGGAQVSPLHANFIVNRGGASSDDVLALIATIRSTVLARTGFALDCEARFVSADGEEAPAHVFTDSGRFDQSLLSNVEYPSA